VSEALNKSIEALEESSIVSWFPCGDGRMPLRRWANENNTSADTVVLLHGGSGSWLHWFRNIDALKQRFNVVAVDLPGLGDAAMCPIESDADSAATVTRDALLSSIDGNFHIVAFSWGCTVTAIMMKALEARLKSAMLTGPASVGNLPRRTQMKPLIKRTQEMSREEVLAVQHENLARLMIHDRARIDDLAVLIQDMNTTRARFSSPQYARATLVIEGLTGTSTPLFVIYGEYDAPAYPDLDARRDVFESIRPDARFEIVDNAGHWLQYEQSDIFNARCIEWLSRNR
jgi:pimeloyl-ACP methyl ester carboxylesterase